MLKFLQFLFSDLWVFIGMGLALNFVADVARSFWSRFMRMLMVRKHGWPPPHLDADGDPIKPRRRAIDPPPGTRP